ncbi:MAG: hypothetical protein R3F33_07605 [Planctomycetota bacterium]
MNKPKYSLLALVVLAAGLALAAWWYQRPTRTTQAFAGHLAHGRYAEAAAMVHPPSSLQVAPDGSLLLTDQEGRSTTVPKAKLPFLASDAAAASPQAHFQMTALGPSTDGVLETPAVTLHLNVEGGGIQIVAVQ